MLMKEALAQLVIEGKKRQTRRPIKAGEKLILIDGVKTVLHANGRIKYQVGRKYCIQYGRGLPTRLWNPEKQYLLPYDKARKEDFLLGYTKLSMIGFDAFYPLKIKLLDVWDEDVRNISPDDAYQEGFNCSPHFLVTWTGFYDDTKVRASWMPEQLVAIWVDDEGNPFASDCVDMQAWLIENRPTNLYLAHALKFEVVK